jgi:Flp pilus assembly protein TadD
VPAYANLADLYRSRGADGEAVAVLREGLARNPRAATLHHALGLALVRQKQKTASLAELRAAAELAPESGRFAYVYAMGLDDAGRTSDALKVLAAAHARHPYDRDVLSALAFLTVKAGDRATALRYANRLRELDPENAEYARMAQQIEGGLPR